FPSFFTRGYRRCFPAGFSSGGGFAQVGDLAVNRERNGHMMAAVLYGREDLKIEKVEIPAVGAEDLLVRVKVALTCGTDFKVWRQGYHARMITPPALFGHELAGIVEEAGEAVRHRFRPGMRVVAANSAPCNECFFCLKDRANLCEDLVFNNGAYAEYNLIPGRILRENVMEIPQHLSFVDAAVIEAVGTPTTWQWATQMVRCGGTVNLFGGCPRGTKVEFESSALHYSEITIKSSFHHTPRFIREALDAISRGEVSARDFVTGEIRLSELPDLFQHMKNRNGQLKV